MELGHVSGLAIAGMAFSTILIFAVSFTLLYIARKKFNSKPLALWTGVLTFVLSAMVLEQILHSVVINSVGLENLTANVWLYALYGAAAAAVFEETGRFIAMKFVLKNNLSRPNAFMYGIGHGCGEAIIIVGVQQISNIATEYLINSGLLGVQLSSLDEATRQSTIAAAAPLWTTNPGMFFVGGIERVSAITLQIAMSFVMYKGVKFKKGSFFLAAFGIHFIADFITVAAAKYFPTALVEVLIAAVAVLAVFFAYRINKTEEVNS